MRAPQPATIKLLLVETDSALAEAAIRFLDSLGHVVQRASSAKDAMALVAAHGVPDLILTDFHLSGKRDGVDLITRLRLDADQVIPAIVMTGDTSSFVRERVSSLATCSFCRKPFSAVMLARTLDKLAGN